MRRKEGSAMEAAMEKVKRREERERGVGECVGVQ